MAVVVCIESEFVIMELPYNLGHSSRILGGCAPFRYLASMFAQRLGHRDVLI